jgi:hypothetical protein
MHIDSIELQQAPRIDIFLAPLLTKQAKNEPNLTMKAPQHKRGLRSVARITCKFIGHLRREVEDNGNGSISKLLLLTSRAI